ncbi:hypothetical protein CI15_06360 [Paraburkholderia monticola]|uniref:Protein phosphatase 2C domain-containing protein n=1 Tax=Paraburkholderia monticola TaxID=1399968 RepID=A0A149PXY0_9BURK|nr:protein phosphatase 2C domain-containing protein [Paraburkholderia monticola]KXU89806.1 hypothetical protein CI15_06360 [Paraburkholderia monticola]
MLGINFKASVPKSLSEQDANEDAASFDLERGIVAISDGASESFDSRAWARLLVARFIQQPAVNAEWVSAARLSYEVDWDFETMSWSQQAAFDRGSFATLLGAEWHEHSRALEVFAVGDSLAVHLDASGAWESHPYRRAEQFDERPRLLSTKAEANAFVRSSTFYTESCAVWELTEGSLVFLMTDALGQWLLTEPESFNARCQLLLSANTEPAFTEFVLEQRRLGAMRIDDTTLMVLSIDNGAPSE